MGLCANDTKRKRPFKTIIIPRGIINPNEHNVIEIPLNLDTTSSLIVKAPTDASTCFSVEPYRGDLLNPPTAPTFQTYGGDVNMPMPLLMPQMASTAVGSGGAAYLPDPGTSVRRMCSQERPRKVDFSCQTQEICASFQKWPCSEQSTQSSFYPPDQPGIRQPTQVQEAHSPLCPICARASCKFLSHSGITRPYSSSSSRFCQFSSTLGQSDPYNAPNLPYTLPNPCYRDASMRLPFIPAPERTRERVDNELLSRMLDEKIERILKPVLFSLSRLTPEEEDREKYVASTCPSKYSYSSIRPRYSRDQCSPRRCEEELKMRNVTSCETSPKLDYSGYEEFRREAKKRDSDFASTRTYFKSTDFDFDDSRRRNVSADRDQCPASASCQKRAGVSFDDTGNRSVSTKLNERIDLHTTSQTSL